MERIYEPNHVVCIGYPTRAGGFRDGAGTSRLCSRQARVVLWEVGRGRGSSGHPEAAGVNGRAGTAYPRLLRARSVSAVGIDSKRDITVRKSYMKRRSRWWPLKDGKIWIRKAQLTKSAVLPPAFGEHVSPPGTWHPWTDVRVPAVCGSRVAAQGRGGRAQHSRRSPLSAVCATHPQLITWWLFSQNHCMSFC